MKHTGPDHWLKEKTRLFAAADTSDIVAYIETADTAENFVTEVPQIQNICGAFCLPAYRGKGLYPNLLNFLIASLAIEGYTLLGVDYESFNPTAAGFGENILLPIPAAWFVALMKMYWPSKRRFVSAESILFYLLADRLLLFGIFTGLSDFGLLLSCWPVLFFQS